MAPRPRGSFVDPHLHGDALLVVVFILTSFTECLTHLECTFQENQASVLNRFQHLEDIVQMHMDTLQMHIMEPLQAAASSASKVQARMNEVVSLVKDLVNPAHSSLVQIFDQVRGLCNDVGDLNYTFVCIEQSCRREPPPPRSLPPPPC